MFSREFTWFRLLIFSSALLLILVSQSYWFMRVWNLAGRVKVPALRVLLRAFCISMSGVLGVAFYLNFSFSARNHPDWRNSSVMALTGLWLSSALFAYVAVKLVRLTAWLWGRVRRQPREAGSSLDDSAIDNSSLGNPERRRFVQAATVVAGSLPFMAGLYGFAFERLRFEVYRTELPIANLPAALDGMRVAQLSDIHASSYMPIAEVRRAVDAANALSADLTVVTGDFITGASDPLEKCIAELSRLHAPLGVWGCNGNHEIYANVEAKAAELFELHGMRLLRQQRATLTWQGQPINLIGVDYERQYDRRGNPRKMLVAIERLVRRDMPNILLSHNPNSFPRSAELGIELMLTGHTHGGQVHVEILDHNFSPARFLTPYVAGLYSRPLGNSYDTYNPGGPDPDHVTTGSEAIVYVNRGLGTIGMPVRLGVPPEITLHTLRCA